MKILLLGSGGLKIGQAGEFDYSGTQSVKALKEENIEIILINPNVATVQTSNGMADKTYFYPITPEYVSKIIQQEKPNGILLSFGGQTALNCGLELEDFLRSNNIEVLGTPISVIRDTEDRELFKQRLSEIKVNTARSISCYTPQEVIDAANNINFPIIIRGAFSLGGHGSSIVYNQSQLELLIPSIFSTTHQVLVEESLEGWKEIEYEVIIDKFKNCTTVCNMENLDPMGVHTGESIVVAPSQTLTNYEYHMLREIAIKTVRHLGIIGECNIQYALNSFTGEYRVIEVNARLSRSSALASKATGYPLAYIATKLALGYNLSELPNIINKTTKAFFEPSLDYCVVKIPRWDLNKFDGANLTLGSSMKSIGEIMAIGGDFVEALQKGLRMVQTGLNGVIDANNGILNEVVENIRTPNPTRILYIFEAIKMGIDINDLHKISKIDPWFLFQIKRAVLEHNKIFDTYWPFEKDFLTKIKTYGFSDKQIAKLKCLDEMEVRKLRYDLNILPVRRQIDTLSAEFPADTNYLYFTFNSDDDEVSSSTKEKVLILGSGVYRIGSSVEFDWSCISAVKVCKELGYEVIVLNCNPETVSTDYDISDQLIFEEINVENIIEIFRMENPIGCILAFSGQTGNNLVKDLEKNNIRILGTHPGNIDMAEDRGKFSKLCDSLHIKQPLWTTYTGSENLEDIINSIGLPLLVRPSYVLSGSAMRVAWDKGSLLDCLTNATQTSPNHPVSITKYEVGAKEIEIDGVSQNGEIILHAVTEHIENAGVHSGDATLVLPPQKIYVETIRKIKEISNLLVRSLNISGPFNIQFLATDNEVSVIECNLRASRSLPFVSKTLKIDFAELATRVILGQKCGKVNNNYLELSYVGIKSPQFSFSRLTGADPVLSVEMSSTGEVGVFGSSLYDAILPAVIATGFVIPQKGVLLTIGGEDNKFEFCEYARALSEEFGLNLFGTNGTYNYLLSKGININKVYKINDGLNPSVLDLIYSKNVDLVINISRQVTRKITKEQTDGYYIRRAAADLNIPLITNAELAKVIIKSLIFNKNKDIVVKPWEWF